MLPNRQKQVNRQFAYLAMVVICQLGKGVVMENRPNRIKELRDAANLTIEQVAETTGLSVSYISRLESGARNLSVKNMNLLAHAIGVRPQELLVDGEEEQSANVVRVMGRIGAGAEIFPDEEQIPPDGLYEIEAPFPLPPEAIAFEVNGESMWPRYDSGDIVICWRQGVSAEEVLGWEAAVKTEDGRRYLKRVLRGSTKGLYDLESHNAPPIRGAHLVWVASIHSVIRSGQWRKLSPSNRAAMVKRMLAKTG